MRRVLLTALVAAACDAPPEVPPVAARDSLGIRILEVGPDQVGEWARLAPEPEWVVGDGVSGGGLVLHRVADVALAEEEGVVWIAEGASQELIGVELGSGEVSRLGGAGGGPAEFSTLARVWAVGPGRLGAFDRTRQRYVEFAEGPAPVRSLSLPRISETSDRPSLYRVAGGPGGERFYLALLTGILGGEAEGPRRGRGPLVVLDEPPDTLTWIAGNTTFSGPGFAGAVMFGATTLLAEGPDGIWVGDSERPEIAMWGPDGDVTHVIRWRAPPEPVTDERQARFWERFEASLSEEERPVLPQLRGILPFADHVPFFGSLLVDAEGAVWVGPFVDPAGQMLEEPVPAGDWLVFDVEGEAAGLVDMPEGFRPVRIGTDYVLGVHTDELGVETVRLHRLEGADS